MSFSQATTASSYSPYADVHASGPHPVLPEGMQRSQVRDLLLELRRALKLSQAALLTLLQIVERTRPSDWTSPDVEPVCYARQVRLASELGKSERAVRYDEARLERMGLIERRTLANGARTSHGGCGLVLSPLIERIPALLALRDRQRAEWDARAALLARRSALYRAVRDALMEVQTTQPGDPAAREATETFLSWPVPAELRAMSLDALSDHVEKAGDLADRLDELLESCRDSSGQTATSFRSYIQTTINTSFEFCNAPANAAADIEENSAKNQAAHKHEPQVQPGLDRLTPQALRAIASDELRLYLDYDTRNRDPRMRDFTLAAIRRLPELGVSPSAWEEAVGTMGDEAATLAVLVIDANRDHPAAPVRRPGGLLRAMARRHKAGELNLLGSLIGLLERKRE
ncbi:replication initiation protein RepC [Jannaschia sp. M317]|uniref:replication initiation protein RepC n=1 Tax=Jannaschia sp. M317 TaxID=2867011 RepID=UPI0021A5373C|nr:replication initiation protein RepC [Jannaschia sp. M317]UWQ19730.1 transposase [Jannaschia sp. M317]